MKQEIEDALKKYNFPERARAIWEDYQKDIHAFGVYDKAESFVLRCRFADALDVKLDKLVSNAERNAHRQR